MRRLLSSLTLAACLAIAPTAAHANFHLWQIEEVFSNASGSIQYIELSTTSSGQQVLAAHTITATVGLTTKTFTFPGNSGTPTTNKHLLIATPGFASIPGAVAPDFTLPCGGLFDPAGTTITINFGEGADTLTITTPAIPTNGTQSLVNGAVATSSPQNFAGTIGTLTLTAGLNNGSISVCDNGLFCDGVETCTASACADAANPCPLLCNETTDTCFECDDAGDCNDGNACTDDSCNGSGVCVRTNNTLACNDGLFCTQTDACSAGACAGTGATCGIQNCSEGGDFCGDCDDPGDCADGAFCNGAETCAAGVCGVAAAGPCDLVTTTCDEATDLCPPICGDGTLDGDEACDDGNAAADDGCADCMVEVGFTCDTNEPSVCELIRDAGVSDPDAETRSPDAEPTTPPPSDDAGCCSTGGAPPAGTFLLLALVALVSRRAARRSRRPR